MNHIVPEAWINMDYIHALQIDALEVQNLRVSVEELLNEKGVLTEEKEGLANEKAGLNRDLHDAKQRIMKLELQSQNNKQRADRLERKVKRLREARLHAPSAEGLIPLINEHIRQLKLESMPTPEVVEFEVRKPSPETPHYDLLEKFSIDTVTNKRTDKKPTLVAENPKAFGFRITCLGQIKGYKGGRMNDGVTGIEKM